LSFVFKVWPEGMERLRELLAHDLEHGVALAARQGAGAGAITAPANALYSTVFEATGSTTWARSSQTGRLCRSRTRSCGAATCQAGRASRRRWSAPAGLYHRAKHLQVAVLGLGGVCLLLWPGPVQWELCVPLGAVLLGGLASVQWAYYKKHM
jgi:hypothetical protein